MAQRNTDLKEMEKEKYMLSRAGVRKYFLVRPQKNCLEFTRPKNLGSVIFVEHYFISNTNFKATIKCSNFFEL